MSTSAKKLDLVKAHPKVLHSAHFPLGDRNPILKGCLSATKDAETNQLWGERLTGAPLFPTDMFPNYFNSPTSTGSVMGKYWDFHGKKPLTCFEMKYTGD